jgi:hypothetical protein
MQRLHLENCMRRRRCREPGAVRVSRHALPRTEVITKPQFRHRVAVVLPQAAPIDCQGNETCSAACIYWPECCVLTVTTAVRA